MKKQMIMLVLGVGMLMMQGCVAGIGAVKRSVLIKEQIVIKDEILSGNYQQILKCFREKERVGRRDLIPGGLTPGISFIVYSELGIAEISVFSHSGKLYSLIVLEKITNDETKMNTYGSNWSIPGEITPWTEILRSCSRQTGQI